MNESNSESSKAALVMLEGPESDRIPGCSVRNGSHPLAHAMVAE